MLRDSHLRCPFDSKLLAVDEAQEEGQHLVWHECIHCTYREFAPAAPPKRVEGPTLMERIRDMVRAG